MTEKEINKTQLKSSDFETYQDIRWCPGCGDFAILKQVQTILPQLGIPRENFVFISGIGCSSRFPYYTNTYGMHSIHGRATAIATGLKISRPELSVWVVTGDGDGLSIGGNHLLHTLRRNVDINILLFNNRIYGLTKGQYSPTSELHKKTKSSPYGTSDYPLNTIAFALGAGATFVARGIDREPRQLQELLLLTHKHTGTSLLEIYQNCHIYNDGTFDKLTNKQSKKDHLIVLEHGKPLFFGGEQQYVIALIDHKACIKERYACNANDYFVHDMYNKNKAFMLSQLDVNEDFPSFSGVFYQEVKSSFDTLIQNQIQNASYKQEIQTILKGKHNWLVS